MGKVSVRELRNEGGKVLARVARGEHLTVTSDGEPVAELRPLPRPALGARELLARWRHLPLIDPLAFRADVDAALDSDV
jgi:prevent-host-death family protein